jgi:anti-sigma factor RsiW
MENKPSNLRESLWRRKLTDAERAELKTQPEWELEARLTQALAKMPDAPVPSNFVSGVLNAIELEEKRALRTPAWTWRLLLPRFAVAAAIMVFAGVGLQRHEASVHRAELAKNLAQIAATQTPSMDALENLDAIQRMSLSGHADGELLAALQ